MPPTPIELLDTGSRRATLYVRARMFGQYIRIETDWVRVWRARYAQHSNAVYFEYRARGERVVRRSIETSKPSLVVLLGWEHFDPPGLQEEIAKSGHFVGFDPAFQGHFDHAITDYIASVPLVNVLLDLRGAAIHPRAADAPKTDWKVTDPPKSSDLILTTLDRDLAAVRRTSSKIPLFVSYFHDEASSLRARFEEEFADGVLSASVYPGEIERSRTDDQVRSKLRRRINQSKTVAVLLGPGTYSRRFVDWEIALALDPRQQGGPRSLVGILCPGTPWSYENLRQRIADGVPAGSRRREIYRSTDALNAELRVAGQPPLPARLVDNLLGAYAVLIEWPKVTLDLVRACELAEVRKAQGTRVNGRPRLSGDLCLP